MKKRLSGRLLLVGLVFALGIPSGIFGQDQFVRIKSEFRKAACTELDFVAVLESDVFDEVDSTQGTIYLAEDGRYCLKIGSDLYLNTDSALYSYSAENDQVTIESASAGAGSPYEISLLRRLDELYETHIITPNREYRLVRRSSEQDSLPDSMLVALGQGQGVLERLEYVDLNGDLTRIKVNKYTHYERCDETRFIPNFPESAKRIKL